MIEDSNKQNEKGKKRNNNNRCHRNTGKKKNQPELNTMNKYVPTN